MSQAVSFQQIQRRLATISEGAVRDQAGPGQAGARILDAKTAALVRIGALAAIGSPEVCLEWGASRALASGASEDEVVGVLLAVAPVIGLGRVVSAASGVADGLGYNIEDALMDADGQMVSNGPRTPERRPCRRSPPGNPLGPRG